MRKCRLLHYGTGIDQQYDAFIINGRTLIKADPFIYNAVLTSGSSEREKRNFNSKAELEKFRDNDKKGYIYNVEERTAGFDEYGYSYTHIVIQGEHFYSPNLFGYFDTECENNLVQLEVDGKWGYADTQTGEIKIEPKWDWCGPFYNDYALVRVGCPGKPGEPEPNSSSQHGADEGLEWTMDSRCGYINTDGDIVVKLKYVDGELISRNGLFIVRKPGGLIGVIDVCEKTIIDFIWYGIEKYESAYSPSWNGFVAYTDPEKEGGSFYSLYSEQGLLVVKDLDVTPNEFWPYPSEKFYKKIETLGWGASNRYLIVWRSGKLGVVADGSLLHEPTLEWTELWPLIINDWKAYKQAAKDNK